MKHTSITLLVALLFIGIAACPADAQRKVRVPQRKPAKVSAKRVPNKTLKQLQVERAAAHAAMRELRRQKQLGEDLYTVRSPSSYKVLLNNDLAWKEELSKHIMQQTQGVAPEGQYYFDPTKESNPAHAFATNAIRYMHTNQHQLPFQLEKMLEIEGINPDLKAKVKAAQRQRGVSTTNADLLKALQDIYTQYTELLAKAQQDPGVLRTVKIYEKIEKDYKNFVNTHHRAPSWKKESERTLYNRFEMMVYNNQINRFELVRPTVMSLYNLASQFPMGRLPEVNALSGIQLFVRQKGFLPRAPEYRSFANPVQGEDVFFEIMQYWNQNSPNFKLEMDGLSPAQPK